VLPVTAGALPRGACVLIEGVLRVINGVLPLRSGVVPSDGVAPTGEGVLPLIEGVGPETALAGAPLFCAKAGMVSMAAAAIRQVRAYMEVASLRSVSAKLTMQRRCHESLRLQRAHGVVAV
jgi:hypothetical protein